MVSMGNPASPWNPEDAMELRGKIDEENVHLDHIFHDDSSSSGEESSLVGTRINGFLDAAADMIQRHLRINVDGDDGDFDMDQTNDMDDDEDDEYDGDDDESVAFDYSVFSKHTLDSLSTHYSGSTPCHQPSLQNEGSSICKKESASGRAVREDSNGEKSSKQGGTCAEMSLDASRPVDKSTSDRVRPLDECSAKVSVCSKKESLDERPIDETGFSGLRSIREDTVGEKRKPRSLTGQKKTVDDGSTCSGTESYGGRSYDEKSFAGLRSVLQLENVTDEENKTGEKSAWLPSDQEKSTDGKSAFGVQSIREYGIDEESASGFQSLGMHSTQETTVDEGSAMGLGSVGPHSNHETTVPEESLSVSQSFGQHSTQEITTNTESLSHSRSFSLQSTQETTIDEGSTSESPSNGVHSIQETTTETRSSFGLLPIQESPLDGRLIDNDNFPKEEGMFGELSRNQKRQQNQRSRKATRSFSERCSRDARSSDSPSNSGSTYDEDTYDMSHDSDSAYFTDEYTNYDTTFTQSTMTSNNYPKIKITQEKKNTMRNEVQKKRGFYVPNKTRHDGKKKPGSNFVDVRDYFIYSDENSIVTQSSFRRKKDIRSSSRKETKPAEPGRTQSSHRRMKKKMQMKRRAFKKIKEEKSYDFEHQSVDTDTRLSSVDGRSTLLSTGTSIDDGSRSEIVSCHEPRLRAISDDVSQITMSVVLSGNMDESFADTNSLTTHMSHFENHLQTCEERSANSDNETNLDTSSIALLSGQSNLDDDQSGKGDSVFDQIRDMGLSMLSNTKEKKNREDWQPALKFPATNPPELSELDKEALNRARLLDIVKREAKLEEAAWKRIERKQAARKGSEARQSVQDKFDFNHFDWKQSFAIKKMDESDFLQQDDDNSLIDPVHYTGDSHSMVSNAISDSVLYNRERSQILHNRRMARSIRKSPSKSTEERVDQSKFRASVSDVGVGRQHGHEKSLEGLLTSKPMSVGQNNVLVAIPARGSTPRDKLRARMMARSKLLSVDSAKVKRDFLTKSQTSTERVDSPSAAPLKSSLKKHKSRVASPAALSSTGILKTMAPLSPISRSASPSTTSSALKAKRVSFATPEKFEFVLKEESELLPLQPKKENQNLDDSFDELVQARSRSPFQNIKKTKHKFTKRRQPATTNMFIHQSPHSIAPGGNSSPTSVLDLPSPQDSFSDSPRISNLEFLEHEKAKKVAYDVHDDDSSSEQSSILMDLSVL